MTERLLALVQAEPVAAQAVVQALLGVVAAFGLGLSAEQVGALLVLSASVLAFFTRKVVTPTPRAAVESAVAHLAGYHMGLFDAATPHVRPSNDVEPSGDVESDSSQLGD